MGLIPDEVIGEIRGRADIVQVIGQHVQLRKAGRNHKGLCPFHNERSPSFSVNADKGFYYCFGCQKKGDVFSFLMEYEGKSFVEAAETLASLTGVEIPQTQDDPDAARHRSERAQMLRASELAAAFFAEHLDGAMDYLTARGISRETAEQFGLGHAPEGWRGLCDHLAAAGIDPAISERVGLIVKQPRAGGWYDRFRERIVCPVVNTSNNVVGFSARRLSEGDEAGAKYINSPESPIYKKSKLLFGANLARDCFREKGRALLVEGNFDVISLHQAGFRETVAPLGTALTDEQAGQLRRLAGKVVLLYDGDKAGRAATLKGLQTLVKNDVEVLIATLPIGEDPDSLVERAGPEALGELIDRSQPAVEYFVHEVWSQAARSADGRAWAVREAAELIRSIADATKRDFVIGTFAAALDVEDEALRRALRRSLRGQSPEIERKHPRPSDEVKAPRYELDMIAILADHPDLVSTAEELDVFSLLTDSRLRDMYCAAREGRSPLSAAPDDPEITAHVLDGRFADVPDPARTLDEMVKHILKVRAKQQLKAPKPGLDADAQRQRLREIVNTRKQVD